MFISRNIGDEHEEDTLEDKYITFYLDSELYGIPIRDVIEINQLSKVSLDDSLTNHIIGSIPIRGFNVPVIDSRTLLGKDKKDPDSSTCIITLSLNNIFVSIKIDKIDKMVYIPKENITNPAHMNMFNSRKFIGGLGHLDKNVIILMDLNNLFTTNEWDRISQSYRTV